MTSVKRERAGTDSFQTIPLTYDHYVRLVSVGDGFCHEEECDRSERRHFNHSEEFNKVEEQLQRINHKTIHPSLFSHLHLYMDEVDLSIQGSIAYGSQGRSFSSL